MDLLSEEYFKIMEVISNYDAYLMTIKGWSITIGLAIIGYAFERNNKNIVLLCAISALCFAVMDAKYKQYQTNYYPRMQTIEECLKNKNKDCIALQVDESWSRSHKDNSLWKQFDKANVIVPHGILFILSLLLFFVPGLISTKNIANKSSKRDAASGTPS